MYGCDGTNADDLTRAIIEGRQQVQGGVRVMQHVPELAGVELVSTAAQLGVRETRHIEGRYRLVEEDLVSGRRFDDGICVVRFNIDIHAVRPAAGTKTIHIEGRKVEPYQIPFRALSIDREHLLMAGRCISGTSLAHASYRVTGDCVAMGQAAGTAAALAMHPRRRALGARSRRPSAAIGRGWREALAASSTYTPTCAILARK